MFTSAQADQSIPLFGSEASGIVLVSQAAKQQQASLAEPVVCVDKTCPNPRKTVIQAAAQEAQP